MGSVIDDKYMMFTLFFNKFNEVDDIQRGAKTMFDVMAIIGGFSEMIRTSIYILIAYFQENQYQKSVLKKLFKVQSNLLYSAGDSHSH